MLLFSQMLHNTWTTTYPKNLIFYHTEKTQNTMYTLIHKCITFFNFIFSFIYRYQCWLRPERLEIVLVSLQYFSLHNALDCVPTLVSLSFFYMCTCCAGTHYLFYSIYLQKQCISLSVNILFHFVIAVKTRMSEERGTG